MEQNNFEKAAYDNEFFKVYASQLQCFLITSF